VHAETAPGGEAQVTAVKKGQRGDPDSVTIQVVQAPGGGVTICAVYPSAQQGSSRSNTEPNECRSGNEGRLNVHDNDVSVDFTVRVPAGVRFVGRTVNGSIDGRQLRSDTDVRTVNGKINLATTGVASARTVNGSIDVALGTPIWTEPLEFSTVNGSINVKFPQAIDAQVRAETMTGGFSSDFPVTIQSSRRGGRRITAVIGNGGRELSLRTVNGSIHLLAAP
jgi:hypothetical protein